MVTKKIGSRRVKIVIGLGRNTFQDEKVGVKNRKWDDNLEKSLTENRGLHVTPTLEKVLSLKFVNSNLE